VLREPATHETGWECAQVDSPIESIEGEVMLSLSVEYREPTAAVMLPLKSPIPIDRRRMESGRNPAVRSP